MSDNQSPSKIVNRFLDLVLAIIVLAIANVFVAVVLASIVKLYLGDETSFFLLAIICLIPILFSSVGLLFETNDGRALWWHYTHHWVSRWGPNPHDKPGPAPPSPTLQERHNNLSRSLDDIYKK